MKTLFSIGRIKTSLIAISLALICGIADADENWVCVSTIFTIKALNFNDCMTSVINQTPPDCVRIIARGGFAYKTKTVDLATSSVVGRLERTLWEKVANSQYMVELVSTDQIVYYICRKYGKQVYIIAMVPRDACVRELHGNSDSIQVFSDILQAAKGISFSKWKPVCEY